jgi:hypothetical protein
LEVLTMRLWRLISCLLVASVAISFAQQRFDSGPYKGFAKEEPELNTKLIPTAFRVRNLQGILFVGDNVPLGDALFEIRDSAGKVISTTTKENGTFSLPNVPAGTYMFKTTKNGFESVVGTVVVTKHAPNRDTIQIQVSVGT